MPTIEEPYTDQSASPGDVLGLDHEVSTLDELLDQEGPRCESDHILTKCSVKVTHRVGCLGCDWEIFACSIQAEWTRQHTMMLGECEDCHKQVSDVWWVRPV